MIQGIRKRLKGWVYQDLYSVYALLDLIHDNTIDHIILEFETAPHIDDYVIVKTEIIEFYQVKHSANNSPITSYEFFDKDKDKSLFLKLIEGWKWALKNYTDKKIKIVLKTNKLISSECNANSSWPSLQSIIDNIFEPIKKDKDISKEYIDYYNKLKKLSKLSDNELKDFVKLLDFKTTKETIENLFNKLIEKLSFLLNTKNNDKLLDYEGRLASKIQSWKTVDINKAKITKDDLLEALGLSNVDRVYNSNPLPPKDYIDIDSPKKLVKDTLEKLEDHIKYVFLSGRSGCGKTTTISALSLEENSVIDFRYHAYNYEPEDFTERRISSSDLWHDLLISINNAFKEDLRGTLPAGTHEENKFLVLKKLKQITQDHSKKIVIAIDGLDHAARARINNLEVFLQTLPDPKDIPKNVIFLIAGQPDYQDYPDFLESLKNPSILKIDFPLLEEADIKLILQKKLTIFSNDQINYFTNPIFQKTKGNPLSIFLTCNYINQLGLSKAEDVINLIQSNKVPGEDPNNHYQRIWDSLSKDKNGGNDFKQIIAAKLVIARNLLPLEAIIPQNSMAGINQILRSIFDSLIPLLKKVNNSYQIYHNDFRLFLKHTGLGNDLNYVCAHKELGEYYLNCDQSHEDLTYHLYYGEQYTEIISLINRDWMLGRIFNNVKYKSIEKDLYLAYKASIKTKNIVEIFKKGMLELEFFYFLNEAPSFTRSLEEILNTIPPYSKDFNLELIETRNKILQEFIDIGQLNDQLLIKQILQRWGLRPRYIIERLFDEKYCHDLESNNTLFDKITDHLDLYYKLNFLQYTPWQNLIKFHQTISLVDTVINKNLNEQVIESAQNLKYGIFDSFLKAVTSKYGFKNKAIFIFLRRIRKKMKYFYPSLIWKQLIQAYKSNNKSLTKDLIGFYISFYPDNVPTSPVELVGLGRMIIDFKLTQNYSSLLDIASKTDLINDKNKHNYDLEDKIIFNWSLIYGFCEFTQTKPDFLEEVTNNLRKNLCKDAQIKQKHTFIALSGFLCGKATKNIEYVDLEQDLNYLFNFLKQSFNQPYNTDKWSLFRSLEKYLSDLAYFFNHSSKHLEFINQQIRNLSTDSRSYILYYSKGLVKAGCYSEAKELLRELSQISNINKPLNERSQYLNELIGLAQKVDDNHLVENLYKERLYCFFQPTGEKDKLLKQCGIVIKNLSNKLQDKDKISSAYLLLNIAFIHSKEVSSRDSDLTYQEALNILFKNKSDAIFGVFSDFSNKLGSEKILDEAFNIIINLLESKNGTYSKEELIAMCAYIHTFVDISSVRDLKCQSKAYNIVIKKINNNNWHTETNELIEKLDLIIDRNTESIKQLEVITPKYKDSNDDSYARDLKQYQDLNDNDFLNNILYVYDKDNFYDIKIKNSLNEKAINLVCDKFIKEKIERIKEESFFWHFNDLVCDFFKKWLQLRINNNSTSLEKDIEGFFEMYYCQDIYTNIFYRYSEAENLVHILRKGSNDMLKQAFVNSFKTHYDKMENNINILGKIKPFDQRFYSYGGIFYLFSDLLCSCLNEDEAKLILEDIKDHFNLTYRHGIEFYKNTFEDISLNDNQPIEFFEAILFLILEIIKSDNIIKIQQAFEALYLSIKANENICLVIVRRIIEDYDNFPPDIQDKIICFLYQIYPEIPNKEKDRVYKFIKDTIEKSLNIKHLWLFQDIININKKLNKAEIIYPEINNIISTLPNKTKQVFGATYASRTFEETLEAICTRINSYINNDDLKQRIYHKSVCKLKFKEFRRPVVYRKGPLALHDNDSLGAVAETLGELKKSGELEDLTYSQLAQFINSYDPWFFLDIRLNMASKISIFDSYDHIDDIVFWNKGKDIDLNLIMSNFSSSEENTIFLGGYYNQWLPFGLEKVTVYPIIYNFNEINNTSVIEEDGLILAKSSGLYGWTCFSEHPFIQDASHIEHPIIILMVKNGGIGFCQTSKTMIAPTNELFYLLKINHFDSEKKVWYANDQEKLKLELYQGCLPQNSLDYKTDFPSNAELWYMKDSELFQKYSMSYVLIIDRFLKPEKYLGSEWVHRQFTKIINYNNLK